jgi:Restriction endonuclease NaeI
VGTVIEPAIAAVELTLRNADPEGVRFARALRRTYDQIYDGRNTGRYSWDQLQKTEKTHFGSLIEINLQREFRTEFEDGLDLDYRIAGFEVDCKWSRMDGKKDGEWMLPPEAVGQICLLLTGNDDLASWSAGLIRAVEPLLSLSSNRDAKKRLNVEGRAGIRWIWRNAVLPENVLLRTDPAIVQGIMSLKSGQKRLNELFRRVPNRVIGRGVVATVAQQDDYMKRVRDNGGSRQYLRPEGIVVFGDFQSHRVLASHLGLPPINDGDTMSARLIVVGESNEKAVELDGAWYRLCADGEEPTKPAPRLPDSKHPSRT